MKKTVETIALVAFAFMTAVSCNSNAEEQVAEERPLVACQKAVVERVIDQSVYSSIVEPWAKNNIAPQSPGRIENLLVEVGDYVRAGQLLATMDDVQLQQSELQINNDSLEFQRMKSLRDKGGISQSDFESFELACRVHRSTYNNVLKNTRLASPISGIISDRNYDKGDMYSGAKPIYVVEQIMPVKLLIGVSEGDYSRVKKGDAATLTVAAFPGVEFHGVISNIYPTIDQTTHTFKVEIKVTNGNMKLRPGMYAKVTVTFGAGNRVIVPDTAVTKQQGSGDRFVYIFNPADSTVKYTVVKPGIRLDDRYVILEGVNEGDLVLTEGILRVKDGVKVRLK